MQTRNEPSLLWFCLGIVMLSALVCVVFLVFFLGKGKRPEKAFPFLALGFGLCFLFAITPLSVPDELTHYKASYELSNHLTRRENPNEANGADFDFTGFSAHKNTSLGYGVLASDFFSETRHEEPIQIEGLSEVYTLQFFAEYLPQAIGIVIARLLDLNFLQTFYLGRCTNLLFYILCLGVAIKKIPYFKTTLGVIGTLPMALQQAASFSYDSYINGLAFVLTAGILKACCDDGPLSRRDYLIMLGCSMMLAPAKGTYSFLILLYLLIPANRFASKKEKRLSFLGILIGCGMVFLITAYPAMTRILNSSTGAHNSVSVRELFSVELLRSITRIHNTLNKLLSDLIEGAIGRALSGLSLRIPGWMIWVEIVAIILSVLDKESSCGPVTEKMRVMFLLISVLVFFSFIFAMLLSWSDKALPYIAGLQGRYLIPVLPLLFMSINNRTLVLKRNLDMQISTIHAVTEVCVLLYIVDLTTAPLGVATLLA